MYVPCMHMYNECVWGSLTGFQYHSLRSIAQAIQHIRISPMCFKVLPSRLCYHEALEGYRCAPRGCMALPPLAKTLHSTSDVRMYM